MALLTSWILRNVLKVGTNKDNPLRPVTRGFFKVELPPCLPGIEIKLRVLDIKYLFPERSRDLVWAFLHPRPSVLSKAPLRSAFLKTGRIRVKYSHNNWYQKQGQIRGIALFFNSLFTRCVVANKESDTLSFAPFVYHGLKGKKIARLSEIEAIQLCSVFTSVPSGNARRGTTVYEINAITNHPDDKRINITSGQKHDQIRSDAAAFAEFLGVPVLDHTVA